MSATVAKREEIKQLLRDVKTLACRYHALTGKPLGVTGEVAEYEAAQKLKLVLTVARTAFYDATLRVGSGVERLQVKGRAVDPANRYRGRLSKIRADGEFEAVLLVLLDRATLDTIEIWRAERESVRKRLIKPGSRARNERGQLSISQFKSIASRVWPVPSRKARRTAP